MSLDKIKEFSKGKFKLSRNKKKVLKERAIERWSNSRKFSVNPNFFKNLDETKYLLANELIFGSSEIEKQLKKGIYSKKNNQKLLRKINFFDHNIIKLMNISLLVVKPEITSREKEIIHQLRKRNYEILKIFYLDEFVDKVEGLYCTDYSGYKLALFREAYSQAYFPQKFLAMIVRHKEKKTIPKLRRDVGHYLTYQKRRNNSLRYIFGKPEEYNFNKKGFTISFNGIHKANNIPDFIRNMNVLQIAF